MRMAAFVSCLLIAGACLAAEPQPTFTRTPVASKTGDAIKITFAVSAAADAEVAILDSKDKVVRHLAAGLLGGNAPEPFRKDSLAQELLWDGKGDYGQAVVGAKARVRVGLKIGPTTALDVRPPNWKLANKAPAKNASAPAFEGQDANAIYWATFGAVPAYTRGAYLERGVGRLMGDPDTGQVYCTPLEYREHWERWYRLDPATGQAVETSRLPYATGSMAFGSDGLIYLFPWGWATWRLDRQWQPAPFSATSQPGMRAPKRNGPEIDASGYGDGMGPEAMCLGLDGKIYSFVSHPQSGYARMHVWGRDGKLEKSGFIPFARARHASNICVDREGFLYVAMNGLPEGYKPAQPPEPAFKASFLGTIVKLRLATRWAESRDPDAGKVPADAAKKAASVVLDGARMEWKIPGEWGSAMGSGAIKLIEPTKLFVADAQAIPGISWTSPSPGCTCSGPWMDMDRFGRLYVPDPAFSRVRVLDSSGNDLIAITEKVGDLAVAWPLWVTSAGDALAFYDGINLRAVYVKLEFAAAETVVLP